ncbi:sigma-70 family RNA polymerase sigma factor [Stieleria sp. JC731]|uniref:RNA polymerase sigma factor n=1 Tax=Pirellulaceae TaxID=2691357 RepID=UPI001E64921F|nr:sigma-70 family RNA polymerase sigma factor [Stieleria sp. JC731]MCC9600270.1 sigma-70 family RNA polymerase sigma factor [Stieleria sp. JC731]
MITASQLADLWRRHAGGLTLLASARCGSDDASDCVQAAFIKLSLARPAPDDVQAWLATVVRNEAISKVRNRTRRREQESLAASERSRQFVFSDQAGFVGPWTRSQIDELSTAMTSLATDERELIIARIWNGLAFREIADLTGRSRSQVHRDYHAALQKLRCLLAEQSSAFNDLFTADI